MVWSSDVRCRCSMERHLCAYVCREFPRILSLPACGKQAQAPSRTQLHRCVAQHIAAEDSGGSHSRSFSTSKRKPRIVLIGWLGAQQRHFDKCASPMPAESWHLLSDWHDCGLALHIRLQMQYQNTMLTVRSRS
jgi:hypothetical protein